MVVRYCVLYIVSFRCDGCFGYLVSTLFSKHPKVGHYQPASETPFTWGFAGGSMLARPVCFTLYRSDDAKWKCHPLLVGRPYTLSK